MKVKSILSLTIVISTLLIQVTFAAPTRYEIIDLGTLGGYSSCAHAINDAGQVVGDSITAVPPHHAFRWDSIGGMLDLGTIDDFGSSARGINNNGQVVGVLFIPGGISRAFIWDSTAGMVELGEGAAWSINNKGQIAGEFPTVYDPTAHFYRSHACIWDGPNNIIDLGALGSPCPNSTCPDYSHAYGINDAGQVVGSSSTTIGEVHAFLWDGISGMRDLGTLGGSLSEAFAINNNGQIVGYSLSVDNDFSSSRAFLWDSSTGMRDLGTIGVDGSYALCINDMGQIVGSAGERAVLFDTSGNGNNTDLNNLIYPNSGWILKEARSINEQGWIVGKGINPDGEEHAYLLKPIPPKIIYVDDDAAGANDGSSWADAFNYLQDALAAAWSGDEILVAQGIYTPDSNSADPNGSGDREATFQLINGVTIKGGYAGFGSPDPNARDIELYETILSGDLNGNDVDIHYSEEFEHEPTRAENSYHVVTGSGTDANAVLDGFTVIGGHANSSSPRNQGGGMYNYYGSPTLVDCIFTRNAASDGGGVSNYFGNPTLKNCLFNGNGAFFSEFHYRGGNGGGMFNSQSSPTVINCTFSDGYAHNTSGGVYNSGGSPTFTHCEFVENFSRNGGGGGMHNEKSSPILSDCRFSENEGAWGSGGGLCNYQSDVILTNCHFSFNQGPDGGGGMCNGSSSLTLTDCTFVSNRADAASFQFGGGMMNCRSNLTLTNCEFRSNKAGSSGGGMYNYGHSVLMLTDCVFTNNEAGRAGGMYNDTSTLMLTDCVFTKNESSYGSGGGIYNDNDSNSTLLNCIFSENSAYSGWHSASGGGIATCYRSNSTVTNCLFNGNSAQYDGGALSARNGSTTVMKNCTFVGNFAPDGKALACNSFWHEDPSYLQLTNCILWDGESEIWNNDNSTITITHTDIWGNWPGHGNIDADPCFVDPGYWDANELWIEGDYHLLPGSPCIDVGDPNYIAEPNETDLDGNPRVIGGRIDMGAYEYSPPIFAEVRITPRKISLASSGKWITAFLRLPESYNVADIDPNSILLEGQIKPERFWLSEDNQTAMAKFDREQAQNILSVGQIDLTITGQMTDGTVFEGADIIKVIDKTGKKSVKRR